jgi:hypothetical protein
MDRLSIKNGVTVLKTVPYEIITRNKAQEERLKKYYLHISLP